MEFATASSTAKFTLEDILAGFEAMETLYRNYSLPDPPWNPQDSLLKSGIDLHDPISLRVYYPFVARIA